MAGEDTNMLQALKAILTDRNFFNYLLMGLYSLSALRQGLAGDWLQVVYWVGALLLTIGVTFK